LLIAEANPENTVPGEFLVVEPAGWATELLIQISETKITLVVHGRTDVRPGARIGLAVNLEKVHLFDLGTGERLTI